MTLLGAFAKNAPGPRLRRTAIAVIVVATVGALFELTSWGMGLERSVGLPVLYEIRGPLSPPPEVVIVSMNKRSIDRMGLSSNIVNWPRALHASLLEQLTKRGAAVIVFDVLFKEMRSHDEDALLGKAIEKSGRAVLLQYVARDTIAHPDAGSNSKVVSDVMISPIDEVAHGAAGLGPFPLPRVPAKVDQFWTFKSGIGAAPTLPVVALQLRALQSPEFARKYVEVAGPAAAPAIAAYLRSQRRHADLASLMRQLRRIALEGPERRAEKHALFEGASDAEAAHDARILQRLVDAYQGADSYFINFYGPAGTITTIPYDKLLTGTGSDPLPDLRGKVVFVGVSELTTTDRKEGFYTVFSREDGIDLSGVEILATSFANLLHGTMVKHLDGLGSAAAVFAFGTLAATFTILLAGIRGTIAAIVFAAIWFAGAQYAFTGRNLWLPAAVPLLVQLPLAVLLGMLVHYGFARRLSENFAAGIRYYVPEQIAHHLALGKKPEASTENVDGVCLFADLAGYTALSQQLSNKVLAGVTTQYYSLVAKPIEAHAGDVHRYLGDGVLGVWTRANFESESEMYRHACLAALEIGEEIDSYNRRNALPSLSIRIGLHGGEFEMGIVGGGRHYEQGVIGDVPNTASRIEGLSKILGTKTLTSEVVAADLETILFRRLGRFQLVGQSDGIPIFEIMRRKEHATPAQLDLCRRFEEMLTTFEATNWPETAQKLDQILSLYPEDGPALYLRSLCERYSIAPPLYGGAVIVMEQK